MTVRDIAIAGFSRLVNRNKLTLTGRTTIIAMGDSMTAGQNASPTSLSYIQRFASALGMTLNNIAVAARGVWNQAAAFQGLSFTRSLAVITVMVGFNDFRRGGSNTRTLKKFEAGLRTIILKAIGASNTPSGHSSVTRTGTFSGFAASTYGGTYGNGTLPGNFASFVSAGGVGSWQWTFSGTAFGIQFSCSDDVVSNYGTCVIKIDGVAVKTVDCGEWYDGISDGAYDNARGPLAFTFHNLANTSHTIRVETAGDGFVVVDFFCTLQTPANSCAILFLTIPYMDATGYATSPASGSDAIADTGSSVMRSIKDEYKSYGYPIEVGETNEFYDIITGLDSADHIHPNNTGHGQILSAALSKVIK